MKIIKRCPLCGEELEPGLGMCMNCGAVLEEDSESADGAHDSREEHASASSERIAGAHLLPAGTLLNDRYLIKGLIGQGGFGITYEGTDTKLGSRVAIKEYYPRVLADRHNSVSLGVSVSTKDDEQYYKDGLEKFLTEARNQAQFLGLENIVYVSDYFQANNTAYIVMEYLDGVTIADYIKEHGPMSFNRSMTYMVPIMNTLEKIHEKHMIHRDISPSNIMILRDGRVKLLDFGAARDVSSEKSMSVIVKANYTPIEQYSSQRDQGPYTDIFALCGTIYTMLTGLAPAGIYDRMTNAKALTLPSALGVDITREQEQALMQGLALNPEYRFQTIAELRSALLGTQQKAPEPADPVPSGPSSSGHGTSSHGTPSHSTSGLGTQGHGPSDSVSSGYDISRSASDGSTDGERDIMESEYHPVEVDDQSLRRKRFILIVIDVLLAIGVCVLLIRRFLG